VYKIPVVFVTDDNYAMPASVAILSLLAHAARDTFYEVFVLGYELALEHKERLESLSAKKGAVKVLNLSTEQTAKYNSFRLSELLPYISKATYARFEIPELFPDYAKILYCDCDLLVRSDLQELFSTDISAVYAGVVRDVPQSVLRERPPGHFNAGVLLLNLDKLRREDIFLKAKQMAGRTVMRLQDQDILNLLFSEKVKYLSLAWNLPCDINHWGREEKKDALAAIFKISLPELDKIMRSPRIVHYAWENKPWQDNKLLFAAEWHKFFNKSPYKNLTEHTEVKPSAGRAKKKPCRNTAVSVIIPADHAAQLPECLDNLARQTLKEIEIICVADAGDAEVCAIVKLYAQKDPRIKLLKIKKYSADAAYAKGLNAAGGNFVCFLDKESRLGIYFLEDGHLNCDSCCLFFYRRPGEDERPEIKIKNYHVAKKIIYNTRFLRSKEARVFTETVYPNLPPAIRPTEIVSCNHYADLPKPDARPKISVIIPAYNVAGRIGAALDSVLAQTLKGIEILIIDDGSRDNTAAVLYEYAAKFPNIQILTQANAGPGAARNKGLAAAQGEYIAFLDADDSYIDRTALAEMYALAREQNADMVSANAKTRRGEHLIKEAGMAEFSGNRRKILPEQYGPPLDFWKNIFRKAFLADKQIKFPEYYYVEDQVFFARVLACVQSCETIALDFYDYKAPTVPKMSSRIAEHFKYHIEVLNILNEKRFSVALTKCKEICRWDINRLPLTKQEFQKHIFEACQNDPEQVQDFLRLLAT